MPHVPGMSDSWSLITPMCRDRPNEEVLEETLQNVERSLSALLEVWDDDPDAQINVVVTVDREGQKST